MGLRINTNIQALNAHKNLTKTDGMLGQSLERLSSGLRINKAADDASGLAIADTLRAQHTGIGQAIANANDGVNIIQIADGALEESLNIVNTIRTKAIQAASDGQSATSRKAIQADVNKLLEELEMIGDTTAYNGISLLNGDFINKSFHVGAYKDQTVGLSIGDARGTKVGAMAYAKTERQAEAAVSSPFLRGGMVTNDALSAGNLRINNVEIGSSIDQLATYGTGGTAWSKAAAINAKVNETGVAAKATTELIVSVNAALSGASLNGFGELSKVTTGAKLVSFINNNASAKENNVRAELIGGNAVRIVAEDGRNLRLKGSGDITINGLSVASGTTYTQRGSLTLSNARAMVSSEKYIQSATINTGDLIINGVDIAAGGALKVKKGDDDKTLVNAINNNKDLQALGIRAELYADKGDAIGGGGTGEYRIRLISDREAISISGQNPDAVAGLNIGTRDGLKTTGIVIEGAATDTDLTADNYIKKIGFDGARYGSYELNGVNNTGGNDTVVLTRAYLTTSTVTNDALSAGNILINGVQVGSSIDQLATYGTGGTAWSKAAAINALVNDTGVTAKATTELVVSVNAALSGASLNGFGELSKVTTGAQLVSFINNNASAKKNNVKAELVGGNAVRIIATDGRNLVLKGSADITVNGFSIQSGQTFTQRGSLVLSNARAMVSSEGYVRSASINEGELIINGVDIAKGGSLSIKKGDDDKTLVNAINNNAELQQLGIRAELYAEKGDALGGLTGEYRLRLISTKDPIEVSGTDPNKVAMLKSGTTSGTESSAIELGGALVDTDPTMDNYLKKLGLFGTQYGTTENTGVNNTAGNDKLVFGQDRLNYQSGDVEINGYKIGQSSDDGISDAKGEMSAAALAAAINLVKAQTGVEADIIKAVQEGVGAVKAGTLQQGDLKINGVDIVRANSASGVGMEIKDGDAGQVLMNAINEYKDQTGVVASINDKGALVLSAVDGRNIHVESTANGNKLVKFEADFGEGKGVAQDSVYMGNIRLVSDSSFKVDGAGSSGAAREISLLKMGLAGGGGSTEATSDLKGDGTLIAGLNYKTAIAKVDVTTQEGAEMAIRSADFAIKRLDEIRSGLGSTQNQLTSTIANLSVTKINVQATESTIRDVDFAAESTTFSKMQVLMQAGTYAQSQANAMSQNVMRLLQ